MSDQRNVRFASLGELTEDELQLAVDVWLEDALRAPWASKETMKLAGVLAHYMIHPGVDRLNLKTIEDQYQLNADSARRALVQFDLYGMIESHSTIGNELRAALRLSPLQMLRILRARRDLEQLDDETQSPQIVPAGKRWVPEAAIAEAIAELKRTNSEYARVVASADQAGAPESIAPDEPQPAEAPEFASAGGDLATAPAMPAGHEQHAPQEEAGEMPGTPAPEQAVVAHDAPAPDDRDVPASDVAEPASVRPLRTSANTPAPRPSRSMEGPAPEPDKRQRISGQDALARSLDRLQRRLSA